MISLSQSIIKSITSGGFCGKQYKAIHIDGLVRQPSTEAQVKGQRFEYLALGSLNREGLVPELPRLKSGKQSSDELRIESQADRFKSNLHHYGITILERNLYIETSYENPSTGEILSLHGTVDALVDYKGAPYVLDLKLTENLHSTFGRFAWGNWWQMDHLQAYLYCHILKKVTSHEFGFLYYVADLTPAENYALREVKITGERLLEMHEAIRIAAGKLNGFISGGFTASPDYDTCKECPLEECSARIRVKPIEVFS